MTTTQTLTQIIYAVEAFSPGTVIAKVWATVGIPTVHTAEVILERSMGLSPEADGT
jgi:hypothetical protein